MQPRLIAISTRDDSLPIPVIRANQCHTDDPSRSTCKKPSDRSYQRCVSTQQPSSHVTLLKQRSVLTKRKALGKQVSATALDGCRQLANGAPHKLPLTLQSPWVNLPRDSLRLVLEYTGKCSSRPASKSVEGELRQTLMSIQQTCQAWAHEAQSYLYQSIYIFDAELALNGGRIGRHLESSVVLLRKTLRTSKKLAGFIKSLHITTCSNLGILSASNKQGLLCKYSDLIASLVMVCPNLEKLTGVQPVYVHRFDKLTHALSTRTRLKQHTWLVGESFAVTARAQSQLSPGILDYEQSTAFLDLNARWKNLEKLKLVSYKNKGILEHTVFAQALRSLPVLKHLHVVGFDADDFTDTTLLALPALESLRLERCTGISDGGLCRWTQSPTAMTLKVLTVIHQDLVSLLTISTLFARLPNLQTFRLKQDMDPSLPMELPVLQPLLVSTSLLKVTWEISSSRSKGEVFSGSTASSTKVTIVTPGNTTPLTSGQHLVLSVVNAGLPCLCSLYVSGNQSIATLLRWAHRFSSRSTKSESASPTLRNPRWSSFYSQHHTINSHVGELSPLTFTQYHLPSALTPWTSNQVYNTSKPDKNSSIKSKTSISSDSTMSKSDTISTCTANNSTSSTSSTSIFPPEVSLIVPQANPETNSSQPLQPMLRAEDARMNFHFDFNTFTSLNSSCVEANAIG